MQRKGLLVIVLIILLTGCVRIDEVREDYVNLVVETLKTDAITNDVALGYKYYLPKGVKLIKKYDCNQKFMVDDTYLYMYVDVNSYYYKSDLKELDSSNYFYYQKISYDGKNGYLSIAEGDDKYFVVVVYNYAKIEFYSDYDNLNKLITLSSIILNSVNYNDVVIEKILDESLGSFSEIAYEIEKPEDASSNFSQYLEEYVKEDTKEELPDE